MTAGQRALTRTAAQYLCLPVFIVASVVGCSKRPHPGQSTGGSASSAASVKGGAAPARVRLACHASGTSFSLGPIDGARVADNSDDNAQFGSDAGAEADSDGLSSVDLPFGVTVGEARAHANGYVVTAIDARQGGSHAILAFLDTEVARGSVLDLGRVYGDAEPPRVVLGDDRAFVVVADTDASGHNYRYGWVRGLEGKSKLEWLGSLNQEADDSAVFSLARNRSSITIAWDELERKAQVSHVRWVTLDATGKRIGIGAGVGGANGRASSQRKGERDWRVNSTGNDVDAEAPQLVARGSGYWLAYLAGESTRHKLETNAANPKTRGKASADDGDTRVIDLGHRGIEVLPLDENGLPNGKPIRVVERTANVVTFDIEATADDGAIVAYRDAEATPGVEAQTIEVARVRPDGGVTRQRVDDERVGAGTPMVLINSSPEPAGDNAPNAWIAVAGNTGETRLASLGDAGQAVLELVDAPQLVAVEPLLWRGDSLLVMRHRGRFAEFERLMCSVSDRDLTTAR